MMKRTKETKNNQDKNMTLHEAIEKILLKEKKELNIQQIADKIIEQKLYKRRDKKPLRVTQVFARIRNYPSLFYIKDETIGLNCWADKKNEEKSILAEEIEFILEVNGDSIPLQIMVDTIKLRNENIEKFQKDITREIIVAEIEKNPQLFRLINDEVELVSWEQVVSENYFSPLLSLEVKEFKNELNLQNEENYFTKLIKSFAVSHFKSFDSMQELSLKPITLLFGPNSSGKSSLIHSLLYLQNAFSSKELDTHEMIISGNSVDLGGFKQLLHKHDYQKKLQYNLKFDKTKISPLFESNLKEVEEIKLMIEISQPLRAKERKEIIRTEKDGKFYYDRVPTKDFVPDGKPIVEKYEIRFDSEIALSLGYRNTYKQSPLDKIKVNHLNYLNGGIKKIIKELTSKFNEIHKKNYINTSDVEDSLDRIIEYFYVDKTEIIPKRIKSFEKENIITEIGNNISDLENFLINYFPVLINKMLEELFDVTENYLKGLKYLGPMRSYPTRNFSSVSSNDPNYFSGGAFAWDILRNDDIVREKVNKWLRNNKLKSNYKLEVRKYIDDESIELYKQLVAAGEELDFDLTNLHEAYYPHKIANIIKDKIKEKDAINGIKVLELIDLKTDTKVSHLDVGFGISQFIPVLVSAFTHRNKIVLIEQPEIHLHPALQAELGDVMIESALGENKNTLILENHSEHMMLRILRRIRETTNGDLSEGAIPIKPEDVAVIYIQNTEDGSKLNYIPITEDGDFAENWPNGFFEEREKELF